MTKKVLHLLATRTVVAIFTCILLLAAHLQVTAQVRSWGANTNGRLGLGDTAFRVTPEAILNSGDLTALSAGAGHVLALKAEGTVMSWGQNSFGQLGDGTGFEHYLPAPVPALTDVTALASNDNNSYALLGAGTVMAWGYNGFGANGNGTVGGPDVLVPQAVPGLSNVISIQANGYYAMALKSDGTVWAWGRNDYGQIGNGTFGGTVNIPTQVAGLSGVISISAGNQHGIALLNDGTIRTWGGNFYGQVGNGTVDQTGCKCVLTPTQSSVSGIVQIAGGGLHTHALTASGTVWTWGSGLWGVLGNNTGVNDWFPTPALVPITDVVEIKTKFKHTLVRKADGSIWAWGYNFRGSIGDGTTQTSGCFCRPVPTQPLVVGFNNTLIAVGGDDSFAAIPSPATPVGNNIRIRGENIDLNFSTVTTAGNTTITGIDPDLTGLAIPPFHQVLSNSQGYDLSTTANTGGNAVTVCLRVPFVFDEAQFFRLRLLHGEGGFLVNRTSTRDYQRREVCGSVTSFSPFIIGENLNPSAATVTIGGRVTTSNGRGISGAVITLSDSNGATRRARTGSFGYYQFDEVAGGENHVLSISSKRYTFGNSTRVINSSNDVTDADFMADDQFLLSEIITPVKSR